MSKKPKIYVKDGKVTIGKEAISRRRHHEAGSQPYVPSRLGGFFACATKNTIPKAYYHSLS
jgi:hypothetical protein